MSLARDLIDAARRGTLDCSALQAHQQDDVLVKKYRLEDLTKAAEIDNDERTVRQVEYRILESTVPHVLRETQVMQAGTIKRAAKSTFNRSHAELNEFGTAHLQCPACDEVLEGHDKLLEHGEQVNDAIS